MELLSPTRNQPCSSVSSVVIQPVRVCFLIDRLNRAGTESQLLALIRTIDRSQIQPMLVLLDGTDPDSRSLEPSDCPILRLGVTRLLGRHAVTAARRLAAFLREHRPDVLQAYFMDSAYFGVPVARWCGVPKIVRVRNNLGYWLTRKHRLLNRLLSPLVDGILTNSLEGKQALIDRDAVVPERVEVIPNGVDLDRFAGGPPPFSRPTCVRVGCVANLRPVKNIDGLIRIARRVCEQVPRVVFEVAGEGPERPELERQIAEAGLGERLILRGTVTDIPGFLQTIDIAVMPSHSEGMSNALLEYMAAGRAIVATNVGANAQLIRDAVDGRIVPPGDETAFTQAIIQMLMDTHQAQLYATSARKRVEQEYSRAAMCQRFEAFYLRLAGRA
ncbi:MAG: glycosyltransferase [Bacteroidales bacterium]|nr:glycosyltransferase [Bacteroidales bacterium]